MPQYTTYSIKFRLRLVALVAILLSAGAQDLEANMQVSDVELERELNALDDAIRRRAVFMARKQARIDSLRRELDLS